MQRGVQSASDSGEDKLPDKVQPALDDPREPEAAPPTPEPTRYGDWEVRGRCIDF